TRLGHWRRWRHGGAGSRGGVTRVRLGEHPALWLACDVPPGRRAAVTARVVLPVARGDAALRGAPPQPCRAYDWREALRPFRNLVRMYPGRMLAMYSALFPVPFLCKTSVFFASKTLQQVHHYSPADVTPLYLTAGVAAPIGNIVAGVLGDRYGRKGIMVTGLVLNAGAVAAFYNAGGFWAPVAWSLMPAKLARLTWSVIPIACRKTR